MQLRILPRSRMAILTSSAVVPGAKFAACTTNGPAEPLIEKPADDIDDAPRMVSPSPPLPLLVFLSPIEGALIEEDIEGKVVPEVFGVPWRAAKSRLFCRDRATAGDRVVGSLDTREAFGLTLRWRSCIHFPFEPLPPLMPFPEVTVR